MIVAGLTGGIASGKSTVSAFFEAAGAVIVDADKIAREVVQKGKSAWKDIVAAFGESVLLPDGEIDRAYLGHIIFNHPDQKEILNQIVHPEVFLETAARLKQIESTIFDAVVILDVPLLIESGMDKDLQEIIVVYVPENVQLQRLMKRDRLTEEQSLARIHAQMPIEEKKRRASLVIDNSGSRENTRNITLSIYRHLTLKNACQGIS